MPEIDLIIKSIADIKGRWRAKETPVSKLTAEKRMLLLGALPSPEAVRLMAAPAAPAAPAGGPALPAVVDWRNFTGGNQISPVKNQGGCGSCVSFGSCALIESMAHIEGAGWLNLSEADSHFCSSHGASCGGWWPDQCLDQAIARGICDESSFPYTSAFPGGNIYQGPPQCVVAPDRAQHTIGIATRITCTGEAACKTHLATVGPLIGCFTVYNDFFSYSSGVYHHVTGNVAGGHCVEVIGYSDSEQCWIIKNSWDTSWGQGGFCKIAYADFKFNGQLSPMYGVKGVKLPSGGWHSLGGVLTTDPLAIANRDGRIEVFARGTDNALWHTWQTAPNNGWSPWASLGGQITGPAMPGRNADGRLEAFARGMDGALWHIWQLTAGGGWSPWTRLGGVITSDPAVGQNHDGRLEIFARGTDGALWHIWQMAPNGGWSGWASLGCQFTGNPTVVANADGRLEAFVRCASTSELVHIWQVVANGNWSTWASLGGRLTSNIASARNADGRIEVTARGTDQALWHIWQTAPNNGWSGWASLGGVITSDPTMINNMDGRLEIFARGTDSALWHIWQTAPNSGWSGWASLGGKIVGPAGPARNLDGRLEVFARGLDLALWHRWQVSAGGGWN